METKKTKRASLEDKKTMFFQVGLLIAMSLALIAFEWSSKEKRYSSTNEMGINDYFEEEMINTFRKEKPQEVIPPPIPQPVFTIQENTYEIEPVDLDWSSETSQGEAIDFSKYLTDETVDETEDIFMIVEDMPKFQNGGIESFAKYVYGNLKYPAEAVEYGITGRVTLGFVVDKQGNVTDITVQRSAHPLLDNEVIRVVKNAPAWSPGKQRGKAVKVGFYLPISFKLQ